MQNSEPRVVPMPQAASLFFFLFDRKQICRQRNLEKVKPILLLTVTLFF